MESRTEFYDLLKHYLLFSPSKRVHKMKSDTENKMSDQLHLKANQRTVMLVLHFSSFPRGPITPKSRVASFRVVVRDTLKWAEFKVSSTSRWLAVTL